MNPCKQIFGIFTTLTSPEDKTGGSGINLSHSGVIYTNKFISKVAESFTLVSHRRKNNMLFCQVACYQNQWNTLNTVLMFRSLVQKVLWCKDIPIASAFYSHS